MPLLDLEIYIIHFSLYCSFTHSIWKGKYGTQDTKKKARNSWPRKKILQIVNRSKIRKDADTENSKVVYSPSSNPGVKQ